MAATYSSPAVIPAKPLRQDRDIPVPEHAQEQFQSESSSATPADQSKSAAAAAAAAEADAAAHKRVYQACIPCRRRKVRCDLGSVDNPHDPPCVRCRRESKECFFSATRRKRKTEDDGSDLEEYIIRNGRRKVNPGGTDSPRHPSERRFEAPPVTPIAGWRSQPLRRPDGSARKRHNEFGEGDATQTLENLEAQTVMRHQMYGPHDALDLLYKAATDRYVASGLSTYLSTDSPKSTSQPRFTNPTDSPAAITRHDSVTSAHAAARGSISNELSNKIEIPRQPAASAQPGQVIDPVLAGIAPSLDPGHAEALRAWTRFRFVRAGWFTAQEAIDYID